MKVSVKGERLYKRITFKLIQPPNAKARTEKRIVVAPPGKGFTAENIENEIVRVGSALETKFPQMEFSLVPVGPTAFNFVCRGPKAQEALV
jgi:hypothetical protein